MTESSRITPRLWEWMDGGTALFAEHMGALDDAGCRAPTPLLGWSRGHVLAHVAANARALGRLASWARTGVESPMYSSVEARDEEIERDAQLPAAELRGLVRDTAEELSAALRSLPLDRWGAEVRTAQGRTVPASVIPWMRCREVWVHAVDLGTGATFRDFPADLVDELLTDCMVIRAHRGQDLGPVLRPSDRDRVWPSGADPASADAATGLAADLAAWTTGRGDSGVRTVDGAAQPPAPGRWL